MEESRTHSVRKRLLSIALVGLLVFTGSLMVGSQAAFATPSQDDIDQARQAEADARKSVNEIEAELAAANEKLEDATDEVRMASGMYEEALAIEAQAQETYTKARADADQAKGEVEVARKELGQVATSVYRSGAGALSSISPYVSADGLESVATRQVAIDLFGSQADAKMQSFAAAKEIADVLEQNAQQAYEAAQQARVESEQRKAAADAALANMQAEQQRITQRRNQLTAELARRHGITVELQRQRQEEIDRQRREQERREAEARAKQQGSVSPATGGGSYYNANKGAGAVAFARSMIGTPYVWGGTSRYGVDCSGMVLLSYRSQGVYLPRVANQQFYSGTPVSFANMQPGDMLGWAYPNGHVYHIALYAGNGMMVESPAPGLRVREVPIHWRRLVGHASRPRY